jgi:hypothetical protein
MYYQKPSLIQSLRESELARQLTVLLTIDIAIGLLYAAVPTEITIVRSLLAAVQFGFMALTMYLATRRVLQDY